MILFVQVLIDYSATLRCPMPGSVISINVKEGQVRIYSYYIYIYIDVNVL